MEENYFKIQNNPHPPLNDPAIRYFLRLPLSNLKIRKPTRKTGRKKPVELFRIAIIGVCCSVALGGSMERGMFDDWFGGFAGDNSG